MDKIVVTTDFSETDNYMIQCLRLLFPDCGIEIVNKKSEIKNIYPLTPIKNEHKQLSQHTEKLACF